MNWKERAIAAYRQEQEREVAAEQRRREDRRLNAEARLCTILGGSRVVVNADLSIGGSDLWVCFDQDDNLYLYRQCPQCANITAKRWIKSASDIGALLAEDGCVYCHPELADAS